MQPPMRVLHGILQLCLIPCMLCFITTASLAQSSSQSAFQVDSFTLIDARTDRPIPGFNPIPDNAIINLNKLPRRLNIKVNTSGKVGSIKITFIGKNRSHIENLAPFSLFGDDKGDFKSGRLREGTHTISATPYKRNKARGAAGMSQSLTFMVIREGNFVLNSSYTPPSSPGITLRYTLDKPAHTRVVLYDQMGQLVETLVDTPQQSGNHEITVNTNQLPAGTYLYRITTPERSIVRQFTLPD